MQSKIYRLVFPTLASWRWTIPPLVKVTRQMRPPRNFVSFITEVHHFTEVADGSIDQGKAAVGNVRGQTTLDSWKSKKPSLLMNNFVEYGSKKNHGAKKTCSKRRYDKILVHSLVVGDSSLKLLILYGNLRQPIRNLQLQVS